MFDLDPQGRRAAMVINDGPRCAAWVINSVRRKLQHTHDKSARFFIRHVADVPPYFDIAMTFLRFHRTAKWKVEREDTSDRKVWKITWLGAAPKPLPASLKRYS